VRTAGHCVVTLHADGSVSVADNGRGTDTRYDDRGRPIKKPVIATRDLRFFDFPDAQRLPDGHPRRGMSTVAALSEWLTHTNRRSNGAWTQRYEHGVPVTDLVPAGDRYDRVHRSVPSRRSAVFRRGGDGGRACGGSRVAATSQSKSSTTAASVRVARWDMLGLVLT